MNTRKLKKFILNKLENELSEKLTYHGVKHTIYVLKSCEQYIKRMNIPPADAYLLRTAAIVHDIGFIWNFENHEDESVKYVKEVLPDWNYSESEIKKIEGMILATKIPQEPTSVLEQIIGDADLDYLGTDSFYTIGNKLYKEFKALDKINNEEDWDRFQVRFLQNHHYNTPFAKKHREPVKQKYMKELMEKWNI